MFLGCFGVALECFGCLKVFARASRVFLGCSWVVFRVSLGCFQGVFRVFRVQVSL